jgi:hypothetical protein
VASLISLTDYKTWAGISGTAQDTVLTFLLDSASTMIRQACERDLTTGFESASRTFYANGADMAAILVPERPITTLTSVAWVDESGTATLYDATDYTYDADAGIVTLQYPITNRFTGTGLSGINRSGWTSFNTMQEGQGWTESPSFGAGTRNIRIVYTGGYATIPKDLQIACAMVVDTLNSRRGADTLKKSETIGQYSYTRDNLVNTTTGQIMGPLAPVASVIAYYTNYGGAR